MNERIKEVRRILKMSQRAFGKRLGVTGSTISTIETGERNLTERMIKSVCREFNVAYLWLTTGSGEMFTNPPVPETALDKLSLLYRLTDKEKDMVHEFLSLPKDERVVLIMCVLL